jgi:hypothetical protein
MILSVCAVWSKKLRDKATLSYQSKEDGLFHTVEEITVCEGAWENNPPLRLGEWRYALSGSNLLIEGADVSSLLEAITSVFQKLKASKEEPLPSEFSFCNRSLVCSSGVFIGNSPLSDYCIFYEEVACTLSDHEDFLRIPPAKQAAQDLADFIGREFGMLLSSAPLDGTCIAENAILLAPASELTRYGDWRIETKGSVISVLSNDICGLESGVSQLCRIFKENKNVSLPLALCGSLQKREEYERFPDAFRPCYDGRLNQAPLSIEEKASKLTSPHGNAFVIAHRGEHTYYPENSLEAALSAWRSGADSAEIDLSRTRDGFFVLMHDNTLTRTTDASEKMGKDGLPNSAELSDWSLAELRSLRLKDTYGQLTDFIIPTLEELFRCCDGRIFLHLDKKFDYKTELFPLLKKWGTYRCLYLCNYIDFDGIKELKNEFEKEGVILPSLLRIPQQGLKKLRMALDDVLNADGEISPAVVFINDYMKYLPHHKELIRKYKGKLRIATWMMWETDSPYFWQEAAECGFNVFMTNFPIRLMKHFS